METQQPRPYPSIPQGFLVILIATGFSILAAFAVMALSGDGSMGAEDYQMNSWQTLLVYVFGLGMTIYISYRLRVYSGLPKKLSFKPANAKVILVSIIAVLCIGYLLDLFMYLVPMSPEMESMFKDFIQPDAFSFITAVIAAPIVEEILMRGIILDGFLRRYTPTQSIVWSAVIFGVFHLNPWQAVAGIASGLLLGWLYWKTRSLILCMLLHFFNNLVAFTQGVYADSMNDTLVETMGPTLYFSGFVAVLLIFIGCMRYLNKIFKQQEVLMDNDSGALPM